MARITPARPPTEEILPPIESPLVEPPIDASSFVGEFFQPIPGPEGSRGGKPQTKQEEEYIFNFIDLHGRAPTSREVTEGFRTQVDPFTLDFRPESTMGRMGFRTFDEYVAAQRYGESFGPFAGGLVPEGGTVLTREGQPFLRTFDRESYQNWIDRGAFIEPPGGIEGAPPGQIPGVFREGGIGRPGQPFSEFYPQYPPQTFERPEMGDPLRKLAPEQVYRSRLVDYLNLKLQEDAPKIKGIQLDFDTKLEALDRLEKLGEISTKEFNEAKFKLEDEKTALLSNLFTEERASAMEDEAIEALQKGLPAEQLPFFSEIQGVTGQEVGSLIQQGVTEFEASVKVAEERFAKEQEEIPRFRRNGEQPVETGTEEQDFFAYANSLNLAPEYNQWMTNQFQSLFFQWRDEGMRIPFMEWVQDFLARG